MTEKELKKKRNDYIDQFQRARNSLKRLTDLEKAIESDEDIPEDMKSDLLSIIEHRTDIIYNFYTDDK